MIKISFRENSDQAVLAHLEAKLPKILQALTDKLTVDMAKLQAHVVGDKLSGQVLQHRTGKLAASIIAGEAELAGDKITGSVSGAGGPAFYGRFHEYGTTNAYTIVPTNKKALAFMLGGKQVIVRSVLHPPIQERSFMRSSLADLRDQIVADLQAAFEEGAHE